MGALNDFTPIQAEVALIVDGQIVGAVGISVMNSEEQYYETVKAGAAALSGGKHDAMRSGFGPVLESM